MKKRIRVFLGGFILLVSAAVFIQYIRGHRNVLDQLARTPLHTVLLILILFGLMFFSLTMVFIISLRILNKTLPLQENFLLSAYSSLINFFGPGQSGPAVRGAYLNRRHGVGIKEYALTTLLYYIFYATFSVFLLFVGSQPWWQTLLLVSLVGCISFVLLKRFTKKFNLEKKNIGLTFSNFGLLLIATALQVLAHFLIYYTELRSINPSVSILQVLTYTGAANLALFVSITPGAIGFRESFLLFTQQMHGISSENIVAANIIDRGVYLIFLGILFVLVVSLHAKDKLQLNRP